MMKILSYEVSTRRGQGHRKARAVPFIYSQDNLDALLEACGQVFSDERIAATMRTAIGVLAATGLRIEEALNQHVDDQHVDDQHVDDVLVVEAAKSAERLVPIHATTTAAHTLNIGRSDIARLVV